MRRLLKSLFRKKDPQVPVQTPTRDPWMEIDSLKSPILILNSEMLFGRAGEIIGRPLQAIEPGQMWTAVVEQVRIARQLRQSRSLEVTDVLSGRTWEFDIRLLQPHSANNQVVLLALEVTEQKRMDCQRA